jgi:hypothetical protein
MSVIGRPAKLPVGLIWIKLDEVRRQEGPSLQMAGPIAASGSFASTTRNVRRVLKRPPCRRPQPMTLFNERGKISH